MTARRYRSKVAESLHELAEGLRDVRAIDGARMRHYDRICLVPPRVLPDQIKALRTREAISQADFAYHLNVSPGLVSQWERGEKKPSGPSLKLLDLVARKGLDAIS